MELDVEVNSLIQKMSSKRPMDLDTKMLNLYDKEKSAVYFASLQKDFEVVKRVIQALSGSILLMQLGVKEDVSLTISMTKKSLDETTDRLKELMVPSGLKLHFDHLKYTVQTLNQIFVKYSLMNDIYFISTLQIEDILRSLKSANLYLKKSSTFTMGLGMISLESSCSCGLH